MAVPHEVILEKMMEEINKAKQNKSNSIEHVTNVKLLCELMIDSNGSHEELKGLKTSNTIQTNKIKQEQKNDEDDPYSIFEF